MARSLCEQGEGRQKGKEGKREGGHGGGQGEWRARRESNDRWSKRRIGQAVGMTRPTSGSSAELCSHCPSRCSGARTRAEMHMSTHSFTHICAHRHTAALRYTCVHAHAHTHPAFSLPAHDRPRAGSDLACSLIQHQLHASMLRSYDQLIPSPGPAVGAWPAPC